MAKEGYFKKRGDVKNLFKSEIFRKLKNYVI